MKILKILLSILILLIAVVLIGVGCLIYFVDPNKLRPAIADAVMKKTGYQVTIDGTLSWSFYPIFSVKIKHMSVANPHQKTAFLELSDVRIATQMSQLFHRTKNLEGDLHIGAFRLAKLHGQKAFIRMHWRNNTLNLNPISAALYQGSLEGVANGSNLSAIPRWSWKVQGKNIQLKPLLEDVNPRSKIKLSGVSQISLQAVTQGKTSEQIVQNLNGSTEFILNNGIVEGVDLNYFVQAADALINKQPIDALINSNQTSFEKFTGSALIVNGIAITRDLLLNAPAFVTKGAGNLNLVNKTMKLELQIASQQHLKTQWHIPVIVEGSFDRPDVRLDTDAIGRLIAEHELERVKEKVRAQIQENIPGKAGDFLQKLLGQ